MINCAVSEITNEQTRVSELLRSHLTLNGLYLKFHNHSSIGQGKIISNDKRKITYPVEYSLSQDQFRI